MKTKGFTLSELIGVVVLLGVIALISVPIINGVITNSKNKAYDAQIDGVIKAAKSWAVENMDNLRESDNYILPLSALLDSKYIEESSIINPKTDKSLTGCVKIRYYSDTKNFTYEYTEVGCTISG